MHTHARTPSPIRALSATALVAAVATMAAFGGGDANAQTSSFTLTSPDLAAGSFAPKYTLNAFGCTGGNVSPELRWQNAPAGTKGFALQVLDLDAPTGSGFWHWAVYNIPASASGLAQGAGNAAASLPAPAFGGNTDFLDTGASGGNGNYAGPCPPAGDKPHRYQFTLYAYGVPDVQAAGGIPRTVGGAVQLHPQQGHRQPAAGEGVVHRDLPALSAATHEASECASACASLLHTGGDARARRMPTLTELTAATRWAGILTSKQRDKVDLEATLRTVPKGGYVCHKGEAVSHWVGVLEGLVKIATTSSEGKLAAFTGIAAGGWFGEGSLLKDEPRYYEAVALRESRIAYVPRAVFLSLLADNAGFGRFLLVQLNERLGLAMSIIEHQRLLGPDGRVAQCLASLLNPTLYPGVGLTLHISQEEIGLLVGLSRQRVNQALQHLQKQHLLRTEHLSMTILDLDGLRRFQG